MSRKLFYLNAFLLLAIIAAVVELRSRWLDARNREEMMRLGKLIPLKYTPRPPIPSAKSANAIDYSLVSAQFLFSRDRNPNVPVEIVAPPPEKPWPKLPRAFGTMFFGEKPRIILGNGPGNQKSYTAGEKIGEIEIVSFDKQMITFAWNGKTQEKKIEELVDNNPMGSSQAGGQNQPPPGGYGGPSAGAAPVASNNSSGLTNLSGGGADSAKVGTENGLGGTKSCVPGDNSPAGTVLNGMKKVIVPNMFGSSCYWEPVK